MEGKCWRLTSQLFYCGTILSHHLFWGSISLVCRLALNGLYSWSELSTSDLPAFASPGRWTGLPVCVTRSCFGSSSNLTRERLFSVLGLSLSKARYPDNNAQSLERVPQGKTMSVSLVSHTLERVQEANAANAAAVYKALRTIWPEGTSVLGPQGTIKHWLSQNEMCTYREVKSRVKARLPSLTRVPAWIPHSRRVSHPAMRYM